MYCNFFEGTLLVLIFKPTLTTGGLCLTVFLGAGIQKQFWLDFFLELLQPGKQLKDTPCC
jgi:hypothetical protein